MAAGLPCGPTQRGAVGDEDIFSSVAIVIEDGNSVAGSFENVVLARLSSECIGDRQSGRWSNIDEGNRRVDGDGGTSTKTRSAKAAAPEDTRTILFRGPALAGSGG